MSVFFQQTDRHVIVKNDMYEKVFLCVAFDDKIYLTKIIKILFFQIGNLSFEIIEIIRTFFNKPTWFSFEFFTFCILEGEANVVVDEDVVEVEAVVAIGVDDVNGAFPSQRN